MKTNFIKSLIYLTVPSILTGCALADLSMHSSIPLDKSEQTAKDLLQQVVSAQGFEVLQEANTYEFNATDDWPGFIGKMTKIWPEQKSKIHFRHNFNTFDGSAEFLDGRRKGDKIGLQTWHYYEISSGDSKLKEIDRNEKNTYDFGLVVFHYFLELPYRLQSAPIKRYYGKAEKNNVTYDLVFTSWGSESANEEHDQYLLYINPNTHLVDYCVYTLRDPKRLLTKHKYGSIAFEDYTNIDGFMVPFSMPVMLDNGVITSENTSKYFHRFSIDEFILSGFSEQELYPIEGLAKKIDSK